ncbi:MAG: hypothetical protein AB7T27_03895 [Kiritimatiellia bacterium]
MSRKKRRKLHSRTSKARKAGFPVTLAGSLLFFGAASLVYLWLCGRCDKLGTEIKALERNHSEVQARRKVEEFKWATMTLPPKVEQALVRHGLVMRYPDKRHTVEVPASLAASALDRSMLAVHEPQGRSRVAMND